jgi:hypothetical protein
VPRWFGTSATGHSQLDVTYGGEPRHQRGPVAVLQFEHLDSLNPMSPGVQLTGERD